MLAHWYTHARARIFGSLTSFGDMWQLSFHSTVAKVFIYSHPPNLNDLCLLNKRFALKIMNAYRNSHRSSDRDFQSCLPNVSFDSCSILADPAAIQYKSPFDVFAMKTIGNCFALIWKYNSFNADKLIFHN